MVTAVLLALAAVVVWPADGAVPPGHHRTDLKGAGASWRPPWARERRARDAGAALANCAEVLTMCLQAGLPTARAMAVLQSREEVRDGDPGLRATVDEVARAAAVGAPVGHLWAARAADIPGAGLLASAWRLSEHSGAPLAPALEATAAALHDDRAAQERMRASAAGARATMWLLSLLPVVGPLGVVLLGLAPLDLLLDNPIALVSTGVGAVLTVLGWQVSDRLLRRALRPPEVE